MATKGILAGIVILLLVGSILTVTLDSNSRSASQNAEATSELSPELIERGKNHETWDNHDGTRTAKIGLPVWVYDSSQGKYVPHVLRNYGDNTVEVQSGLISWRINPREALIYGEDFADYRATERWIIKLGNETLSKDFVDQSLIDNSTGVFITNTYSSTYDGSEISIEVTYAILDGQATERVVKIDRLPKEYYDSVSIEREWADHDADSLVIDNSRVHEITQDNKTVQARRVASINSGNVTESVEPAYAGNDNSTSTNSTGTVTGDRESVEEKDSSIDAIDVINNGELVMREYVKESGDKLDRITFDKNTIKFTYDGWNSSHNIIRLVDPTATLNDPTQDGRSLKSGSSSTTCNGNDYSRSLLYYITPAVDYSPNVGPSVCERGYIQWDISNLTGTVIDTRLHIEVYQVINPRVYDIRGLAVQPSSAADQALWNAIASGNVYLDNTSEIITTGSKNLDLGSSADSDLQTAIGMSQTWFAVGIKLDNESRDSEGHGIVIKGEEEGSPPTLEVTYIPPGGIFAGDSRIESSGEQRLTYFDGTRMWIFFYNGACNISYSYSTDNGATWNGPSSASTGCIVSHHSVYGEGNNIVITFTNSTHVLTKKGIISGSSISWSPVVSVMTVSGSNSGQNYYPSFEKVGSTLFLGFNVISSSSNVGKIYSSTNLGDSWLSSTDLYSGETNPATVGIAEYGDGNAIGIIAKFGMSQMQYKKWNGTGWSTSLSTTSSAGLTANASKVKSFSVTSDGDNAWVAYTPDDTGGSIRVIRFDGDGQTISYRTAITGTNYEPTIASQAGNVGIFFVTGNNITLTTVINGDIDDWHMMTLPFGYGFSNAHNLHAEKKTSSNIIQVSWREGTSSPYFIEARVTDIRDTDNDGLYDSWESSGIDFDADGSVDLILPDANPNHKDIYVEIDYMDCQVSGSDCAEGSHRPNQTAIDNVVNVFSNAPVSNPNSVNGIAMHINMTTFDAIPHDDNIITDGSLGGDFSAHKTLYFGTSSERQSSNALNILDAKRYAYHYSLWVHQYNGGTSSGIAELPGNDFIVSLGGFGWGQDPDTGHTVGTLEQQAGTFMHELGHNLFLYHGGHEDLIENCKPNYLSVMSYTHQTPNYLGANWVLDYSRSKLAALNETNLAEPDGIQTSTPIGLWAVYGQNGTNPVYNTTLTGIAADWNRNNDLNDAGISQNINNLGINQCEDESSFELLEGSNDWANLILHFSTHAEFADGFNFEGLQPSGLAPIEMDVETMHQILRSHIITIDILIQGIPENSFNNQTLFIQVKNATRNDLILSKDSALSLVDKSDYGKIVIILERLKTKTSDTTQGAMSNHEVEQLILELNRIIDVVRLAQGLPVMRASY